MRFCTAAARSVENIALHVNEYYTVYEYNEDRFLRLKSLKSWLYFVGIVWIFKFKYDYLFFIFLSYNFYSFFLDLLCFGKAFLFCSVFVSNNVIAYWSRGTRFDSQVYRGVFLHVLYCVVHNRKRFLRLKLLESALYFVGIVWIF